MGVEGLAQFPLWCRQADRRIPSAPPPPNRYLFSRNLRTVETKNIAHNRSCV